MTAVPQAAPARDRHNIRRLLPLHAVVVSGQAAAVIAAGFWLGGPPPDAVLAAVLGFLVAANLLTWRLFDRPSSPLGTLLFAQLLADLAALATLLYFTGGATNPFVWLLLLSVTIAATVLPKPQSRLIAFAAIVAYTLLMWFYRPLPDMHLPTEPGFALHIVGMWIGFMLSTLLIAHFVAGMAASLRLREAALAEAREQALRDERLVSLGALAASAAHELGTPLGTLTVLAGETALDLETGAVDEAQRRLAVMREQLRRCKRALAAMASAGAQAAESGHAVELATFVQETVAGWRRRRDGIDVRCHVNAGAPRVQLVAERSLASALVNLFDNAADASPQAVEIDADWNADELALCVRDRGRGLAPAVRERVGKMPVSAKPGGHGLGLYLSQGIIGRLGGSLSIHPREGGGTVAEVRLPLASLKL